MSFSNYDNFQGQPPAEDGGAPGAAGSQSQTSQMQQSMEGSGQFQGAAPGAPGGPGVDQQGNDSKTTLWYENSTLYVDTRTFHANYYRIRMGELEPWMDEGFVRSIWFGMGEQVNVKMIRDKFSG